MDKTLRIMLRLKSSYRINSILYGIGQFPVLGRFLPEGLYRMRLPKAAAAVLGLLLFHTLTGVREGTFISALLVGTIARLFGRLIGAPVQALLRSRQLSQA